MVTDQQVRRLMKFVHSGDSLAQAASKAAMDEKTARKYRRTGKLPSQLKPPRLWRTRPDPFAKVWPEVEQLLNTDPAIEAVTIFDHLCRIHEGQFQPSQLRTLQRHVKVWRAQFGPLREVFFPQIHSPGQMAQSDFTHMGELAVTIQRHPFDHLFYHFTLTYSNWETGSICFSESFESLAAGLQNALWELGAVPVQHRTDSLSAAVNNLSEAAEFTVRYKALMAHYGLTATHNHPGRAHENGDVEQSHNRFKKAVDQELRLRGSRDFTHRQDYDDFLRQILRRRNAGRQTHLQAELAVMQALPRQRLEDYTRLQVRVSRNATISVRGNLYSVNSQLMGEQVEVRLYAETVEAWYGGKLIHQMARLRGKGRHAINYRHIIHSLVRKPGAFAAYRFQSDLFPRLLFRVAYDGLQQSYPATADRQYVKILQLAAEQSEELVEEALRWLIERGETISEARVRQRLESGQRLGIAEIVQVMPVALCAYDALLGELEVLA